MYPPWHGTSSPAVAAATSGPRIDSPSQSSSQSSYQMSQMRWLPSMMSRTTTHSHNSLPTISSNLRLGQQQQQHHPQQPQQPQPPHQQPQSQPHPHHHHHHHHHQQQQQQQNQQRSAVSVVVESRGPQPPAPGAPPAPESVDSDDSDRSDTPGGTPGGRDAPGPVGLGDGDYAPSPGLGLKGQHGRRSGVVGGGGRTNGLTDQVDDDLDGELLSNGAGGDGDGGKGGDASRKHGKRLTTKEEVSLFEICNRHAADFGQRSNLCKWWMTVTMEFTRGQSHPYSWHSVRRKVELVTKQRMKFLDEQREKGGSESDDLSNPRWRAVVDAWIPTWQRWEEAEARRIEKRDSRRPRKRKWAEGWDLSNSDAWRAPSAPLTDLRNSQSQTPNHNNAHPHPQPQPQPQPQPAAATTPLAPTPPIVSTPVRLPPGFDNMFSNQTTTSRMSGNYGTNQNDPPSTPSGADSTMMVAVLETLGKLNRHLDAANTSEPRSSPVVTSFTPTLESRAGNHLHRSSSQSNLEAVSRLDEQGSPMPNQQFSPEAISKLKEELRREMREEFRSELEKDRATWEEKLDSVQRTQEMILEMLRQEPS